MADEYRVERIEESYRVNPVHPVSPIGKVGPRQKPVYQFNIPIKRDDEDKQPKPVRVNVTRKLGRGRDGNGGLINALA